MRIRINEHTDQLIIDLGGESGKIPPASDYHVAKVVTIGADEEQGRCDIEIDDAGFFRRITIKGVAAILANLTERHDHGRHRA